LGRRLYVGEILGAEATGDEIANIFGEDGFNIYCDPLLAKSAYLQNLSYQLQEGGWLARVNGAGAAVSPTPPAGKFVAQPQRVNRTGGIGTPQICQEELIRLKIG